MSRPKSLFMGVLLALVSQQSCAAWVNIGSVEKDQYYIHSDSLGARSSQAWVMTDLHTPLSYKGKSVSSTRNYFEFDCASSRVRSLDMAGFSGPKLSGSIVVKDTKKGDWRFIPPNTPIQAAHALICGRSKYSG